MREISIYLKIGLAILLLICLADMSYGYYQLVRVIAASSFIILAVEASKKNYMSTVYTYIALAVLFQPIIKIALGRTIWNIVDVLVAILLVISILNPGILEGNTHE